MESPRGVRFFGLLIYPGEFGLSMQGLLWMQGRAEQQCGFCWNSAPGKELWLQHSLGLKGLWLINDRKENPV